MRGIGLTHAFADISGLAFDRLFMVTETDGTFITARQFPQMVKFIPAPLHEWPSPDRTGRQQRRGAF